MTVLTRTCNPVSDFELGQLQGSIQMNILKTILIVSLVIFAAAAQAQTIMIRGATVHTMGKDGVLENTDVFISGRAKSRK